VFANALQVFDQVPGGVVFKTGVWRRTTAAALIERDDAVQIGIEITTALGIASGTRAAVNEHDRQAFGRTTFIDIQDMRFFDSQIVPGIRFDLRVQSLHRCSTKSNSGAAVYLPLGIINPKERMIMPPFFFICRTCRAGMERSMQAFEN
jgi:hypothetical protein